MHEKLTHRFAFVSVVMTVALCASACSSNTAASTTAPTAASRTTDTFSATVGQLGTTGIPFSVSSTGTVTIELTSVAPLATMSLGVGIASWDGTTCATAMTKNDNAREGGTALTGTATAGNYCVTVYDSGNIPEGWTVQVGVQVVHP